MNGKDFCKSPNEKWRRQRRHSESIHSLCCSLRGAIISRGYILIRQRVHDRKWAEWKVIRGEKIIITKYLKSILHEEEEEEEQEKEEEELLARQQKESEREGREKLILYH